MVNCKELGKKVCKYGCSKVLCYKHVFDIEGMDCCKYVDGDIDTNGKIIDLDENDSLTVCQ